METYGKRKLKMKKLFFIILHINICLSLIFGCGASFPSEDDAKSMTLNIFKKIRPGVEKINNIEITNKFKQKIEGENYYIYEFNISGVTFLDYNYKLQGMQVAFIYRGQKLYGKLIMEGTAFLAKQ